MFRSLLRKHALGISGWIACLSSNCKLTIFHNWLDFTNADRSVSMLMEGKREDFFPYCKVVK